MKTFKKEKTYEDIKKILDDSNIKALDEIEILTYIYDLENKIRELLKIVESKKGEENEI